MKSWKGQPSSGSDGGEPQIPIRKVILLLASLFPQGFHYRVPINRATVYFIIQVRTLLRGKWSIINNYKGKTWVNGVSPDTSTGMVNLHINTVIGPGENFAQTNTSLSKSSGWANVLFHHSFLCFSSKSFAYIALHHHLSANYFKSSCIPPGISVLNILVVMNLKTEWIFLTIDHFLISQRGFKE